MAYDEDLLGRVKRLLSEQLGMNINKLAMDASLKDLGADKVRNAEIFLALEYEFETEIPDDLWDKVVTVEDTYNLIYKLNSK